MAKKFLEVFPSLHITDELRELLNLVEVEKVTLGRDRSSIRIYLMSPRLIHKQNIYGLEKGIKDQLFPSKRLTIKIIERFCLSGQYTPQKLLKAYRESLLTELKNYSIIEYNMFRKAEFKFPEPDLLRLTVEDTIVTHEKAGDLKRILEKIFHERCGMPVEIQYDYIVPKENELAKQKELQMQREVEEIVSRTSLAFRKGGDQEEYNSGNAGGSAGASMMEASSAEFLASGDMASAATGQSPVPSLRMGGKKESPKSGDFDAGKKEWKDFKKGGSFYGRRSDNPDVLYGRDFDGEIIEIEKIDGEIGEVVIRGKILTVDSRELRSQKTIMIFDVTDFTDTITVKMFAREEQLEDLKAAVVQGSFIRLKGVTTIDKFDGELTLGSVVGIKKSEDFTGKRMDNSLEKRVELHCHTKMSDMDGVSEVKDIVKRAKRWGMPAIAITDHGCVQAFPDANHALDKGDDFKLIYGVEGYLVDDLKQLVDNSKNQSLSDSYVVFDIETTGFSSSRNRIIEIGAVKVENGTIADKFSTFVNPDVPIPFEIEKLTGINDNMVLPYPKINEILPRFLEFCGNSVLVAHNAAFDVSFIAYNAARLNLAFEPTVIDTVALARLLLPNLNRYKLDTVAKALVVSLENHHRAVDDAGCTAEIFVAFVKMLRERGVETLDELNGLSTMSADMIKKLPTHHVIILAANDVGRVNLYRLISYSHIDFYARRPRIPKSVLNQNREGLIVGSACEAGEIYQALLRGVSDAELAKLVNFYDYLEIQPLGNNGFMLRDEKSSVKSEQDLIEINQRIVTLGEQFGKPVCATCDVHFLDPEDEVYRRIIMAGQGFKDSDDQAPLYLRTTEEMLKEFQYLGPNKAEEVVIKNTRKIADMCEKISPVRPDKCAPVIENSDEDLRKICYDRAYAIYGENLPSIVIERLERELHSIISNGFAVMYIIAQKLVWKSNEDGYLVGSRGSVGSSFVAYLSGITEVNSLSPHYYCASCHYYDFDSDEVKQFSGMAGCDMPDKVCPVCGLPLAKDGFDIPFETFLGFKGDKEPDIDLNFSGEYQSKAHDYTEVIFGKGQTFRAGTIGTLADKTAFGYVKNYYEEHGVRKRNCEISRIVQGCVGVRRTTGQHPGGIIVLPHGEEIYSFTPVQRPANDMTTMTVTTHFDYHSIDHNLLKLDILGHDDPTMIRMLQDLIGFDPVKDIPLDSKEVMSLFQNTSALGITPEDIGGCKLGALGVPEFGTDFAMQMLIDTQPKYFSDLVRIAGLAHGTDVWLGNAQTLIQEGKATIQTAICTRDDIMIYLISMGIEEGLSFSIMESVRKGKGLKTEWEEEMTAHGVPDWYIWSCKKIKYMFPKAHAAAYVMMAWRIAYCKVFYPLAYYASFFSIRANGFSYELMCQGRDKLEHYLADYKKRMDTLSKKEQDTLRDMRIVQEMYARGYDFMPIDIYRAKARHFQIIDGKLMPSLSSIDGLGEKAADAIVDAGKDGAFLSREDFRNRTKVSKTVCDLMGDLELLFDLPESNQLSLFDLG
ncbi:PolC-type DNA polymerase III [Lacrimispora saccharolytica]|uniref:DNA polymerase III PolC-type n=1 Tax=Lacrimispora saccharolytica (strain ATCC 35040 / DSM 2544 / NRCC 2533 / WM1) TaxID=610130 RepID=D9QZZ3_LACSW|nr:PolC-type DNA polymerase III [Lacrimispora saccharolytica]ADL04444.1 DNA polymerase III, alpha subunit [[Clostridium] saccharolyticum WM1]QRV21295.1 PolC-type DNA polymerase III [Lacrimispora saccharolytica]